MSNLPAGRELTARVLGVVLAAAVMGAAWRTFGWPAPGVSIALGVGAYLLLRDRREE